MINGNKFFIISSYPENTKPIIMSTFSDWFKREYKQWSQTQPGEEDFLAFCSLLGYTPETVLTWMHGKSIPQDGEVLGIAALLGMRVYTILGLPVPDKSLLETFASFSHLTGEFRSRVAHALWEADVEMRQRQVEPESDEAKAILTRSFEKWGFSVTGG